MLDECCPKLFELREDGSRSTFQSDNHIRLRRDQLNEGLNGWRVEDVQSAA